MKKLRGIHTNLWLQQLFDIASKQVGPSEQVSALSITYVQAELQPPFAVQPHRKKHKYVAPPHYIVPRGQAAKDGCSPYIVISRLYQDDHMFLL